MEALGLFKRILFCTDFSADAAAAFRYALDLCRVSADAELTIFHVIPEPDAQFWRTYIYELDKVDEKAKRDIDKQLQADYLCRIPEGMRVKTKIAIGAEDEMVLQAIKEEGTDLLVMVRPGHGKPPGIFFGDRVKTAVHKARCPVLVIPGS